MYPCGALVLLFLALWPVGAARADPGQLRLDLRRDLALTAAAAAASFGIGALSPPTRCVICGASGVDERTRGALRLGGTGARDAATASDWLVGAVLPAGAVAASAIPALAAGAPVELLEDGLVVVQAVLLAADANALAKQSVGRARPSAAPGATVGRSFYSAHTSHAFALAVSAATVATIRGRSGARWVWLGGLALAASVGYLRMASDSHWLTDVAVGAAVGGGVGFSVPWFLHRGGPARRLEARPAPGGLALSF